MPFISPCAYRKPARMSGASRLFGRGLRLGLDHRHGAARLFDGGLSASGNARNFEIELRLEFTIAEEAHAILRAADHACGDQSGGIDLGTLLDLAGIDGGLDAADLDRAETQTERVREAALRQAHLDRHLAALIALDRDA